QTVTTLDKTTYFAVRVFGHLAYEPLRASQSTFIAKPPAEDDVTLKNRVYGELSKMAKAGELEQERGGQAKAIREICDRLGLPHTQYAVVKAYVHDVWKAERAISLNVRKKSQCK